MLNIYKCVSSIRLILIFTLSTLQIVIPSCSFYNTYVKKADTNTIKSSRFAYSTKTPVKAHMLDGSVVIFSNGFKHQKGIITGNGMRSDLYRNLLFTVTQIPIDSVGFLEYYTTQLDALPFFASLPVTLFGASIAFILIFGSCPTVYTPSSEGDFLEAELFSHSITKRFEMTDFDRIEGIPHTSGKYEIKIRNEAFETHYINMLNLAVVDYPQNIQNEIFADDGGHFFVFGDAVHLDSVTSRTGKNVLQSIRMRDDSWYQSDTSVTAASIPKLERDWIDVIAPVPSGAKTMFIAMRIRNSLMLTVMFYDIMLRSQGMQAIDWMNAQSGGIPYDSWKLHNWFEENFGLNISLLNGEKQEHKRHLFATGPIAWHQTAVSIPAPKETSATLRFEFLPDNWQIDWIGVAFDTDFKKMIPKIFLY